MTDDGLPTPPGVVTTVWSVVSGPGIVTFGDAMEVDTTASFSLAGAYVLRLTADDSALTAFDDIAITVNSGGGGGLNISNVTPGSYVVVDSPPGLQVGSTVYIDRSYLFTTVPSSVQGEAYIQTANNDKAGTGFPFLSFMVDQPVTVYVAHDGRLSLPSWLTSPWVDTGQDLVTSDTPLDLFVRAFPAGLIELGGNESGGGGGSMYSVIVKPEGLGNQGPTVSAGPDQTVTFPNAAVLNGTVTDDGLPTPPGVVTTVWSVVSGPGIVTFGDAMEVDTTASFSLAGAYVLRLTADDSALTAFDDIAITVNSGGGGGFTAYNDLAWGTGQLNTNITRFTSPNGPNGLGLLSSGKLKDFATGLDTAVTLTVSGGKFDGDANHATHGANPLPGTDAYALFDGKVTGQGAISYINQAGSSLVLTFTGLDPSKVYDLAYFAHRDNYAWERASLVTLSGQAAFTNSSSAATDNPNEPGGVLFTGPTDISTRLPADNDNGYVARFSTIDPGSDGIVELIISFDGDVPSQYKGKYGSAVRLQESGGGGGGNTAPTITSDGGGPTAAVSVPENQTGVTTVTATDPEIPPDPALVYSLNGGVDLAAFTINASSGLLRFVTAPDFEAPTDVGGNNIYDVIVGVDDGQGGQDTQAMAVTITDVVEGGGNTTLLQADFDVNANGFGYQDDSFRGTNQPNYASGQRLPTGGVGNSGGLEVFLGGLNNADILNMSGGWNNTFTTNGLGEVVVFFRYNLIQAKDYESDEFSQMLFSINNNLIGTPPNDYVAHIVGNGNGGVEQSTGWVEFVANLGILPAGNYSITLGGYNNKKTYNNESTRILIDDLLVTEEMVGGGNAGFTAYNDLAWGTGQLNTNITRFTSPNGPNGLGLLSSGKLKDFATGLDTAVTLTVSGGKFDGDANHATHGANPLPGTDAYALFDGKVTGQGAISYINQAGSSLVLTFTGLDPSKVYDLAYFAHRDNYAWERASLVTLSGQAAFTNSSSAATDNPNEPGGVLFTGPTDISTRLPADNDNGYVARFSTIDPGSDGIVELIISFDGDVPSQYKGKYGSAVRLQEE